MSQSMMYTMPLMFGFFALSFATGLSIYFIISNLIGVLQYWALNKFGMMGTSPSGGTVKTAEATAGGSSAAQTTQSSKSKSKRRK